MKPFDIKFLPEALEDVQYFKRLNNTTIERKISKLLSELKEHPYEGTGQVEALRYGLTGKWSRRINKEHRLIYRVDETEKVVFVYSLRGHYLRNS